MSAYYHPRYSGKPSHNKPGRSGLLIFITVLLIAGLAAGWFVYSAAFDPNVDTAGKSEVFITIPTGSTFDDVKESLYTHGTIIDRRTFELMVRLKKYEKSIKPGRYKLTSGMGNLAIINLLRSGAQQPVNVTFNNIRTVNQLAGRISHEIEADSASIMQLLSDSVFLDSLGVTRSSLYTVLIPDTYQFYWNTNALTFLERMKAESEKFWSGKRSERLKALNMNRHEVVTLASIVEKETNKNDEKARVAGVYMNRLQKGWLLEADPTLVFAYGDFGMRRILNIHKQIDSPYNTYKYKGLPPGPICLPSIASIEAVLNYEQHDYMFFCAREDFSGYHNFAKSIEGHMVNARKYQAALNRRNIFK